MHNEYQTFVAIRVEPRMFWTVKNNRGASATSTMHNESVAELQRTTTNYNGRRRIRTTLSKLSTNVYSLQFAASIHDSGTGPLGYMYICTRTHIMWQLLFYITLNRSWHMNCYWGNGALCSVEKGIYSCTCTHRRLHVTVQNPSNFQLTYDADIYTWTPKPGVRNIVFGFVWYTAPTEYYTCSCIP